MTFHFYPDEATPIFTGNAPTSLTDLVLPASVPLSCVVRLRFVHKSTGDAIGIGLRPNGNTTIEIPAAGTPAGVSGCTLDDTDGVSAELMSATTDRTVEWGATVAQPVDVHLVGYHDATVVDPTCAGAKALTNQAISTSWTTDLNIGLAAARVIVLLEVQYWTGTDKIAWRPSDETEDVLLEYGSAGLKTEYNGQPNGGNTDYKHVIMTMTGTDGLVDASSVTSSSSGVQAYVHATIAVDDHYATALATYNITTSYTNLDLSGVVGAVDGIAVLKVKKTSLSKVDHRVGFRRDGSSEAPDVGGYPTNGGCNIVRLNDFDEHIPSIGSLVPADSSTQATNATVGFSVTDAGSDGDYTKYKLKINGAWAYSSGWQGGYNGTISDAAISCTTHPALPEATSIAVQGYAEDDQLSSDTENWSFTTNHPPTIGSLSPSNGATGVSALATVSGSFSDAGSDVQVSTVVIVIDGSTAYTGGSFQSGFNGTVNASGFSVTLHPEWDPLTAISCSVQVSDSQSNSDSENWSFTTASGES